MTVHDQAHFLARTLQDSEEYKEFKTAKEAVEADEQHKQMLGGYKRQQMKMQAAMMAGQQPKQEEAEQLQRMAQVLQFVPEITRYLMAEYRLHQLIGDVYKIIGDAVEIDLGFMWDKET